MFAQRKVTLVIPAGRRRYLRLLMRHVLAARDVVDACHLWVNTRDAADLEYLRRLAEEFPGFIQYVPSPVTVDGTHSLAWFYSAAYRQPGELFVRLDDDIVWLAPGAISRLLEFHLANPGLFLSFGAIWNNQVIDHLHQSAGLLPAEPFIERACTGSSWTSGPAAERIHRHLLAVLESGGAPLADRETTGRERWNLLPRERCSINFICWRGENLEALSPDGLDGPLPSGDEEHYLTCIAPEILGRRNAICAEAAAAHFAFFPQREHMDRTGLLELWERHAPANN